MATNSVSLIVTDPPYFIDGMDDGWNRADLVRKVRRAGVVGSLPVGMKFDRGQGKRLQEFLQPIAKDWLRIQRPGGFVLCFSQNRLVHRAAGALEEAGFEIRDVLAWKYEGQAKAFTQDHFVRKRKIPEREKTSSRQAGRPQDAATETAMRVDRAGASLARRYIRGQLGPLGDRPDRRRQPRREPRRFPRRRHPREKSLGSGTGT